MRREAEVISGFQSLQQARDWAKVNTLKSLDIVCEAILHGDKPVVIVRPVESVK